MRNCFRQAKICIFYRNLTQSGPIPDWVKFFLMAFINLRNMIKYKRIICMKMRRSMQMK